LGLKGLQGPRSELLGGNIKKTRGRDKIKKIDK
jgi:hypothetical protein